MRKFLIFFCLVFPATALCQQNSPVLNPRPELLSDEQLRLSDKELRLLQDRTPIQNPCPDLLSDEELRVILAELYELESCRRTNAALAAHIDTMDAQHQEEKKNWEALLEVEKQQLAVMQETLANMQVKLDTAQEKAAFFEEAYRAVTKKRSFWCSVCKFFSFGLAKCI